MAARDVRDSWINRCRSFAEGVVVMVSPVLLAFALTKVNLTQKEHGRVVPIIMLVFAAVTLVAGICPFIAFSLSKFWSAANEMPKLPRTVTKCLALICSAFLVVLSSWIMNLIIYNHKAVTGAVLLLMELCIIARSVQYFLKDDANLQEDQGYYNRLENSLECLAGVTALLFVALESLALESYVSGKEEAQRRLTAPMLASFCTCTFGVFTMFLATIPPSWFSIITLTVAFDFFVGVAVSLVMFFMMYALVGLRAVNLLGPVFLIFLVYVLYIADFRTDNDAHPDDDAERGDNPGAVNGGADPNEGYEPPASLELTKVTFVGFLAISIPSISNGSVDRYTECFTHLSAAAIVSGLMWRILTHLKSDDGVRKAALNVAAIFTHLCIVIAVVPFAIMAGKALPATASAIAPAP